MVEIYDGLVAESQNCWPSLDLDVMSINDLLSSILVAGFYYKTFMWPASFWEPVYERIIRRSAGMGIAPDQVPKNPMRNKTTPYLRLPFKSNTIKRVGAFCMFFL